MRKLKPKQFHQLFWELYDYQMSQGRIKIPPHDDNKFMSLVVSFVQPQILNRLYGAKAFPPSDERRDAPQGTPPPEAGGHIGGDLPPPPPKLSQDKISQVELSQGKAKQKETPNLPACSPPESEEEKTDRENEGEKQGYGTDGQVMLTPKEYHHLTKTLGIPLAYIDHFAEKNALYEHRIQNHAQTIATWWEQDKHKSGWATASLPSRNAPNTQRNGESFDTDDFFEAAVRRSMGDAAVMPPTVWP